MHWSGLVIAKLSVVYLVCIFFSVVSLLAIAITTAFVRTPVTLFLNGLTAAALLGIFYASATMPVILLVLWLNRGTLVSILLCVLYGVAQGTQLFGGLYFLSGSGPVESVSLSSPILWTFPMLVFRWYSGFVATGQLILASECAPFYLDTIPLLILSLLLAVVCGGLMIRLGHRQEV